MSEKGTATIGMGETFSIRVRNIAIHNSSEDNPKSATVTFEIFVFKHERRSERTLYEVSQVVTLHMKDNFPDYDRIVADAADVLKTGFDHIPKQLELLSRKCSDIDRL